MAEKPVFRDLCKEWWDRYLSKGNYAYALDCWKNLERSVFPVIGDKPVTAIKSPTILKILRKIEANGNPVKARKLKSHISQTFRYGIALGLLYENPARDLTWALSPHKSAPRPAILEPKQIGKLMQAVEQLPRAKRRLSLKFLALTFVRPGEICTAEWDDIEWNDALWRIPAAKMKMKKAHIVPLSRQALDILRELKAMHHDTPWIFPSQWDRQKHENGNVYVITLKNMGYQGAMTAHGFRAMAATTLSENGWPSDAIERQLAHVDQNQVRAAYQRSELLAERRKMMQWWADWLDLRTAQAILGR